MRVVRDGSFLAVIAKREEQAEQALQALEKRRPGNLKQCLEQEDLFEEMLQGPAQSALVVDGTPVDDAVPPMKAPPDAAQMLADYTRPYQMHAPLGPSAAVAHWW